MRGFEHLHRDNEKILVVIHMKERNPDVTGATEQCLQSLSLEMLLFYREKKEKSFAGDFRMFLDDNFKAMLIAL